jgi:hypothetical protein
MFGREYRLTMWTAGANRVVEPQSDDFGKRLDLGPLLGAERGRKRSCGRFQPLKPALAVKGFYL